jgi:hypothetical protein
MYQRFKGEFDRKIIILAKVKHTKAIEENVYHTSITINAEQYVATVKNLGLLYSTSAHMQYTYFTKTH